MILALLFGGACTREQAPETRPWTSSVPMEPIDTTTPEGRAAWSNAMDTLREITADQKIKVDSMRTAVVSGTNMPAFAAELDKQERRLNALTMRLNEEVANRKVGPISKGANTHL